MEETLSKFMSESVKRHEEKSNMIKEIRASTDATVRNQGASIKTLEIQIGQIRKVLQERGFRSLPSSTKANPRDYVKSISTTVEADSNPIRRIGSPVYVMGSYGPQFSKAYSYGASHIDNSIPRKEKDPWSFTLPCHINNFFFDNALADLGASVSVMPLSTYLNLGLGELSHTKLTVELADKTVKYPKGIAENMLVGIGKFVFPIDFINLDMLEDVKVPLILERPFLSTAHAKIDVFKRKITLRVGDEKIIFKSVKPASSLIKRVYMLSLRERMKLDLEARLMGETLLRRDQVDDLMPTIEECEVIDDPMIDIIKSRNNEGFDESMYSVGCGLGRKIGHGTKNDEKLPRLIEQFQTLNLQLMVVAAAAWHAAVVGRDGRVRTWGWGRYGCFGHGNEDCDSDPKVVESLSNVKVVHVATRDCTIFVVSNDGDVYTFGCGESSSLGHNTAEVDAQILCLNGFTVVFLNGFAISFALENIGGRGAVVEEKRSINSKGKFYMFKI
ncbi:hypothetical protein Tco_0878065 [Tanacetum coccineum]|uniref:Uncharacterized protein n=1 Tax=Tanacetum coccineum TaxID=301880 RepID=A0ABQ5C2Q8_9ASTR